MSWRIRRAAGTYHILMGIHNDIEAEVFRNPQDIDRVGNEVLVVATRPGSLERLPSEDIANRVVTPATQAGEVRVCLVLGEGSLVKGDRVAVEEVLFDMGELVGVAGQLAITSDIDAAKYDGAAVLVAELAVLDGQSKLRHDAGDCRV